MKNISIRRLLGRGLTLAIPLGVVIYVLFKLFGLFQELIKPMAVKMGIEHVLGGLALTIFTVFLLFILLFLLGLLMQVSFVAGAGKSIEDTVFKFIPSLNQLKLMAAEKLHLETASTNWKPVMALYQSNYYPAFLIEETSELVTLYLVKGTTIDAGEILITNKSEMEMVDISASDIQKNSKLYGKGYIELIKKYFNKQ